MREPYRKGSTLRLTSKGLANHPGAEGREILGEAKDRGTCRSGMELRNHLIRRADPVTYVGRPHGG